MFTLCVCLQLDPAAYRENRIRAVNLRKEKGINPYPHKFNVSAIRKIAAGHMAPGVLFPGAGVVTNQVKFIGCVINAAGCYCVMS